MKRSTLRLAVSVAVACLIATAASADGDSSESSGLSPVSAGSAKDWLPELSISVFGSATFGAEWSDPDDGTDEQSNSFEVDDFVLFLSSKLSDRVSFFSEVVLETEAAGVDVDLERLITRVQLHEGLDAHVGRGHTAMSLWNRTYHHGSYLQTTIATPTILGSLLPRHFVGVELNGSHVSDRGVATLALEVANGRGNKQGAEQNVDDLNRGKMVSLVVGLEPEFLSGLGVHAGYTWDETAKDPDTPARDDGFEEQIASLSLEFESHPWKLIAEGHFVWHDDRTANKTRRSHGGYAQLAKRCGSVTPYYRFEWLEINGRDAFYAAPDSLMHTAGGRWDFAPHSALKLEVRRTDSDRADENSAHLNLSFGF